MTGGNDSCFSPITVLKIEIDFGIVALATDIADYDH